MAGSAGSARISRVQKMRRKDACNSLGQPPTANLGTQKARAHTHPNCCHSARTTLWRRGEWLAALELLASQWCKKSRGRPPTGPNAGTQPQISTRTKLRKACILSVAMVRRHSYGWYPDDPPRSRPT